MVSFVSAGTGDSGVVFGLLIRLLDGICLKSETVSQGESSIPLLHRKPELTLN